MSTKIKFILNGNEFQQSIEANWTLLYLLREKIKLTGTKEGCSYGECGACTVLVNNKAVNACIMLAIQVNGKTVTTIEGLILKNGELDPLQTAFINNGGIQCGFCTPGMIMSAKALLNENNKPNKKDIKTALSGNICRCTGYSQIIESIQKVIKKRKKTIF